MSKILIEEVIGKPSHVDADKGVLYDCLLLGAQSRNGTRYPTETREAALPLFLEAKINLSHPSKRDKSALTEQVSWDRRYGKVQALRNADDGIRGDVKVLKKHPFTATLMEAAEEMPEMFGFSPVMVGDVTAKDENGVETCVKIKRVKSVDIVSDPATTKSLYEDIDMQKLLREEEEVKEEAKESPEVHEEEKEELEEIDHDLQMLIEQVTHELVDFHHDHKDPEEASKRVGQHIKHHAKMHLGKEEKEEEPKEEAKEEPKEETKEESFDWNLFFRGEDQKAVPAKPAKLKYEKVKSGYSGNFNQPVEKDWAKTLRGA